MAIAIFRNTPKVMLLKLSQKQSNGTQKKKNKHSKYTV